MLTQSALTKILLDQWGKSSDDLNIKLYSRKWFFSSRKGRPNSLRLSTDGFDFLTNTLDVKSYKIPLTNAVDISPQTLIFLERYIDSPYFLTHNSITVFSDKKCVELCFFSDDLNRFGLAKAMKSRRDLPI